MMAQLCFDFRISAMSVVDLDPGNRAFKAPVDILITTPHKCLSLMKQKKISVGDVRYAVIDEADTLFDVI
jgi:ATP-dependent RNA helicase RhlE